MRNVNIGIMGHVDAGKTSLARWLSECASTAAFDKSPQSQQRGITLDLGFSMLTVQQTQCTLVDCPGHASLFRTVIGAANIIDMVVLVVDASKGIQPQTAECLVLAAIVTERLVVCVNKIDLIVDVDPVLRRLRKQLANIERCRDAPIIGVSVKNNLNREGLMEGIGMCMRRAGNSQDLDSRPFIMAIDHGFRLKGQASIITGTVLQGTLTVNDALSIPECPGSNAKVRTMQSFRRPIVRAVSGDRIGICCDLPRKVERSIAVKPNEQAIVNSSCFMMDCSRISFFKEPIRTKQKYHISVLHETVLCKQVIFAAMRPCREYEIVDEYCDKSPDSSMLVCIVELDKPMPIPTGFLAIASKMDMGIESKACRLAFYGRITDPTVNLSTAPLYKVKQRQATVDRIVDSRRAIGRGLIGKEGNLSKFIGWALSAAAGNSTLIGTIQSPFGSTGKFNVARMGDVELHADDPLLLTFKKYILQPGKPIRQ